MLSKNAISNEWSPNEGVVTVSMIAGSTVPIRASRLGDMVGVDGDAHDLDCSDQRIEFAPAGLALRASMASAVFEEATIFSSDTSGWMLHAI